MEMMECDQANGGSKIRKENDEIYFPNWLIEVLAWIKRVEMANSALSTASRTFHSLCLPKLHGKNVRPHSVHNLQVKHQINDQGNAVALAKCKIKYNDDNVVVKIPNVPMPKYILGFQEIDLSYFDAQIFAFMQQIAPSIGTIDLEMPNIPLPAASPIRQLLDMLAEQTTIYLDILHSRFRDSYPVELFFAETIFDENANVIKMQQEASKNEGKQRQRQKLFRLSTDGEAPNDLIKAIKNDFLNSTQPFNFLMYVHFDYPEFIVENKRTAETLAFHKRRDPRGQNIWNYLIRHPNGQGEQWLAAGKKRFWQSWQKPTTKLIINKQISEFMKASEKSKVAAE